DIDSKNLRAALLLEKGSVEEAKSVLNIESLGSTPSAETLRLRALCCLVRNSLSQGRLEILKALEMQPNWQSVKFTKATFDYYSALSPIAIPSFVASWPNPVEWALVRQDDESTQLLEEAARVFRDLATSPGKPAEERQILETWCLASTINQIEKQDEALL